MSSLAKIKSVARNWVIPPGFQRLCSGSPGVNGRKPASGPSLGEPNQKLKGSHEGKRCFILATGPSIKNQDLSPLANELCIGTSFFFLHEQAQIVKPEFHLLAPNHAPFDFELPAKYLEGLEERYDHEYQVVYGTSPYEYSAENFLKSRKDKEWKKGMSIGLIDNSARVEISDKNFQNESIWDIAGHPFLMRTVVYGGVQLAAYLGCKEIVLLGCDHNYLEEARKTREEIKENHHFYDESEGNEKGVDFFTQFSSEQLFHEYYIRWRDFRLMGEHLAGRGIRIFNATDGGALDVFPRKSLESIFPTQ